MMHLPVGVVEGFYGRPYSWAERRALVDFLAAEGYDHYLYAPKADGRLREQWTEPHEAAEAEQLRGFATHCRQRDVAFRIGLSPALGDPYDAERFCQQLLRRVEQLLALTPDGIALLCDDVRNHPDLARRQIAMVDALRRSHPALSLSLCPTYYTTSPILDRVFGERPAHYLEELGAGLDPSVAIFWTGPKVCSELYPDDHLDEVTALLRRRPWIWDNYPVNDGPRMYRFLRLRGFPPRTAALARRIAGLSANPMTQPWLSRLSLAGLPGALQREAIVDRDQAFLTSGARLLPAELFELLRKDLPRFHDAGLDVLSPDERARAIQDYSAFEHPAAEEVVCWLRGGTRVDDELAMG